MPRLNFSDNRASLELCLFKSLEFHERILNVQYSRMPLVLKLNVARRELQTTTTSVHAAAILEPFLLLFPLLPLIVNWKVTLLKTTIIFVFQVR